MENTPRLYDTLVLVLSQHRNWLDIRHLKTLAWMMVGLIESQVISLTKWVPYVHSRAQYAQRDRSNMICRPFKCLFVHVPKTAGQSVEQFFMDRMGLDWDTDRDQAFPVELTMICDDRSKLLADLAKVIADQNVNILKTELRSRGTSVHGSVTVQVKNLKELEALSAALSRIKGVHRIARKGEALGA